LCDLHDLNDCRGARQGQSPTLGAGRFLITQRTDDGRGAGEETCGGRASEGVDGSTAHGSPFSGRGRGVEILRRIWPSTAVARTAARGMVLRGAVDRGGGGGGGGGV